MTGATACRMGLHRRRPPFPMRQPKPPRDQGGHGDHVEERAPEPRHDDATERELRERALLQHDRECARDREREHEERGRECERQRERERTKSRSGRRSCNDKPFSWSRQDDDDKGNYNHPGHGKLLGANFWGAGEPFQRERTRQHQSPLVSCRTSSRLRRMRFNTPSGSKCMPTRNSSPPTSIPSCQVETSSTKRWA
jgi:hypothetical protein